MAELVNIFEAYRYQNQTTIQTAYSCYHMYITVVLSCLMSCISLLLFIYLQKQKDHFYQIIETMNNNNFKVVMIISCLLHWQGLILTDVLQDSSDIHININLFLNVIYHLYLDLKRDFILYRSVLRLSGTSKHSKDCIKYNSLFKLLQVASLIFILIVIQYIA